MVKQRLGTQLDQIHLTGDIICLLAQFAQEISASEEQGQVIINMEEGILDTLWQSIMLLGDYTTYFSDELNTTLQLL